MDPALATISQLEARLGVALGTLAGADLAKAQADLEDASSLVRAETGRSWLDADNKPAAPDPVVTVVLKAALRCYRNAEGYTSESEDGYTWRREPDSVTPYLIEPEIQLLRRYAVSSSKLYTLPTTRAEPGDPYFLTDQYGGDPILVHDADYRGPW